MPTPPVYGCWNAAEKRWKVRHCDDSWHCVEVRAGKAYVQLGTTEYCAEGWSVSQSGELRPYWTNLPVCGCAPCQIDGVTYPVVNRYTTLDVDISFPNIPVELCWWSNDPDHWSKISWNTSANIVPGGLPGAPVTLRSSCACTTTCNCLTYPPPPASPHDFPPGAPVMVVSWFGQSINGGLAPFDPEGNSEHHGTCVPILNIQIQKILFQHATGGFSIFVCTRLSGDLMCHCSPGACWCYNLFCCGKLTHIVDMGSDPEHAWRVFSFYLPIGDHPDTDDVEKLFDPNCVSSATITPNVDCCDHNYPGLTVTWAGVDGTTTEGYTSPIDWMVSGVALAFIGQFGLIRIYEGCKNYGARSVHIALHVSLIDCSVGVTVTWYDAPDCLAGWSIYPFWGNPSSYQQYLQCYRLCNGDQVLEEYGGTIRIVASTGQAAGYMYFAGTGGITNFEDWRECPPE